MENSYVTVFESFRLSPPYIDVEIQHSFNGLIAGTILQSQVSNKKWEILARIIYIQVEGTRRFKNENELFQRFTFRPAESMEIFEKKIKENEHKSIYTYQIKPIGHTDKPATGEKLAVIVK